MSRRPSTKRRMPNLHHKLTALDQICLPKLSQEPHFNSFQINPLSLSVKQRVGDEAGNTFTTISGSSWIQIVDSLVTHKVDWQKPLDTVTNIVQNKLHKGPLFPVSVGGLEESRSINSSLPSLSVQCSILIAPKRHRAFWYCTPQHAPATVGNPCLSDSRWLKLSGFAGLPGDKPQSCKPIGYSYPCPDFIFFALANTSLHTISKNGCHQPHLSRTDLGRFRHQFLMLPSPSIPRGGVDEREANRTVNGKSWMLIARFSKQTNFAQEANPTPACRRNPQPPRWDFRVLENDSVNPDHAPNLRDSLLSMVQPLC
ncbi:hypothetical protein GX50_08478 [[Emmonsia] crescens]|uniref:Uncharacterized protein n=1 Tax=[Emmonsia] crescens TaxID=73230 RepID=A0A2B7Z6J9_9EURO|nr:hypothetical protein GX50_08478 [Emmonsia crescens]